MSECSILIVEDETIARENLAHVLERDGCHVRQAVDGQDALQILAQEEFDLVITDLKMPGMSGLEVLEQIKATSPDTEVLVVTGHATVNTAVEAMQKGAYHYLEKPFKIAELRALTEGALEKRRLRLEVKRLRLEMAGGGSVRIVGESPAIRSLKETIAQVAPVDSNVLILGETGTGKELVARSIHMASSRSINVFLRSTVPRSMRNCWPTSCSDMKQAPLPAPGTLKKACLNPPTRELFFWMKLAT